MTTTDRLPVPGTQATGTGRYQTSPVRQEASRTALVRGRQVALERADARRENYAWLRTDQALSPQEARAHLGISESTGKRYEAWMKENA